MLAPLLFERTKTEVAYAQVPNLSQKEFNIAEENKDGFYSNFVFTINDFSNKFHLDNDFNSYMFGIWAPISCESGKLSSKKNGFESKGGEFLFASYKVCVDFHTCDGIVEIIWRGKTDFHSTIPSSTSLPYTRIGSSIQVNKVLVQRIKNLVMMQNRGENTSKKIRGVGQIMTKKTKNVW